MIKFFGSNLRFQEIKLGSALVKVVDPFQLVLELVLGSRSDTGSVSAS